MRVEHVSPVVVEPLLQLVVGSEVPELVALRVKPPHVKGLHLVRVRVRVRARVRVRVRARVRARVGVGVRSARRRALRLRVFVRWTISIEVIGASR